jgi:hypothetical protein
MGIDGEEEEEEEKDIDEEWRKTEKAIKESAEETIGEQKNTRNEEWFDEECANFIEEKNKARKKMIEREMQNNSEKCYELRKDEKNQERICPPTKQETERCVRKMRNNRAPVEDNAVVELIKYGGTDIIDTIHKLINIIWELECMPKCWKTGIICPIFKKGDKLVCENYRGITLLNVVYKKLSGVLNERLKEYAEKILGEYQCGFHSNRSTIDQIFIMRQMLDKHIEHESDLYMLFADFKQAFHSVNRKKLIEAMNKM